MKGLILKDIYCLRTRIMAYVLTLVAALAIGIRKYEAGCDDGRCCSGIGR